MSEFSAVEVQAKHDAWIAEKAASGAVDPGFPGDDGHLYYSDDDDFWTQFDPPKGKFEPEGELQEAKYVEGLHPRDRVGRWMRKIDLPKPPQVTSRTGFTGPLVGHFKDSKRAEAWLKDKWPDKTFILEGADMKVTGPALVHFVRLADKFPFAVKEWAGIRISGPRADGVFYAVDPGSEDVADQLERNAHAGIRRSDRMLLLGRTSWGNPDAFRKDLEAAKLAEWHPPGVGTPEAMLTHEFGHLLDTALSEQRETAFIEPFGTDYGNVAKTWELWKKESDQAPVSGYAVQASRGVFDTVDDRERVAEAFTSIFHTPDDLKDEYVQRLESLLDEIADESKWVEATNDRSIWFEGPRSGGRSALTDAETEAWKEHRKEWMAQHFGPLWTIKNTKLYSELYDDAYGESVTALWERRNKLSAELRGQAKEKKAAAAAKWVARDRELRAGGMSHAEAAAQLMKEGRKPKFGGGWND